MVKLCILLCSRPSDSPYPEIRQPPKSTDIIEGNSARFSTMVVGTPRPVVNWYINGILVQPIMPIEESSEAPRESIYFDGLLHHLELRQCRPEESGIVTVEAIRSDVPEEVARAEPNAVVTATASLKVQQAPGKIPQLRPVQSGFFISVQNRDLDGELVKMQLNSISEAPTQQTKPPQPPVIVQGPHDAGVEENAPVVFICQVVGTPSKPKDYIFVFSQNKKINT